MASSTSRQPRDNGHMAERLEVQRAVAASAGEIFAVLTDPRGHVAIDSSGMLMEASGDTVAKAGDTFVVHMDREALNDYPLAGARTTDRSAKKILLRGRAADQLVQNRNMRAGR